MSKNTNAVSDNVPVQPSEVQYNRYNMTLPQSFSVYNNEGSVVYRGEVEKMANQLRAEVFGIAPPKKTVTIEGYTKKRTVFLIIPLVLSVLFIAIAVIGLFGSSINDKLSLYLYGYAIKDNYVFLDPLFSFLKKGLNMDINGLPVKFADQMQQNGADAVSKIAGYALPISIVLYSVFSIIMLVVSIVGLAGKKDKNGLYRKAKLGFLSIIMFLCALIIMIGGLFAVDETISDVGNFFTGGEGLSAGVIFYAILVIPVITFICTCLAYGKSKVEVKAEEDK